MAGIPDFDASLVQEDLKVCTTNCLCDWIGTHSCEEDTGECTCRETHSGHDCGECAEGHSKDPETGECHLVSKCKDQGGKEDCHGHGTCVQRGERAVCNCEAGFVNDGLLQCMRCTDPLFVFPDCQQRSWILEEPDVNCKDLTFHMPEYLYYQSHDDRASSDILQGEDGIVNWGHKYRLIDGSQLRHASMHSFMVPTTSVLRLFVDTVGSGVLVKYRLLDDQL